MRADRASGSSSDAGSGTAGAGDDGNGDRDGDGSGTTDGPYSTVPAASDDERTAARSPHSTVPSRPRGSSVEPGERLYGLGLYRRAREAAGRVSADTDADANSDADADSDADPDK